ncbi:hypothetical protein B0T19DRAFT_4984 [Cercophora scortea]|uniref:Uncharacterized protein n=1 Tax=Cercophora scortea TaxID=314031 RepID=A0AAE0MJW7_9PEZI|nr:hypothetical protein B0T19DRAFT_4984 [Cercophora scortea]
MSSILPELFLLPLPTLEISPATMGVPGIGQVHANGRVCVFCCNTTNYLSPKNHLASNPPHPRFILFFFLNFFLSPACCCKACRLFPARHAAVCAIKRRPDGAGLASLGMGCLFGLPNTGAVIPNVGAQLQGVGHHGLRCVVWHGWGLAWCGLKVKVEHSIRFC